MAKYGKKRHYSKVQVDVALKSQKLGSGKKISISCNKYAYAMFCSDKAFNHIENLSDEGCEYEEMRSEVSKILLFHLPYFTFSTLLAGATVITKSDVHKNKKINKYAHYADIAIEVSDVYDGGE